MPAITKTQLEGASLDADSLNKLVNGVIDEPNINRVGNDIQTIPTWRKTAMASVIDAIDRADARFPGKGYTTRANLFGDLTPVEGTYASVDSDPSLANNGLYRKVGAAGSGTWAGPVWAPGMKTMDVGPYFYRLAMVDANGQILMAFSAQGLESPLGAEALASLQPQVEAAVQEAIGGQIEPLQVSVAHLEATAPAAEVVGPYGYGVLYVDSTGQIVAQDGGQVTGARQTVAFVALDGDDGADGKIGTPVATVARALQVIGGRGAVVFRGGDWLNVSIPLAAAEKVEFYAHRDERVRFMNGYPLTLIAHPTDAGIYQATIDHARRPGRYVWEHETPEGLIPDDERHPFNQGRTHRMPSSRLEPVSTYADLQSATAAAWWYDGAGTLYLRGTAGADPLAKTYYVPDSRYPMCAGATGWQRPSLFGIEVWYGYGIDLSSVAFGEVEDCYVLGSRNRGLVRDRGRTRECRVEVAGADQDGASSHTYATEQHSTFLASDSYYHDNGDDGASDHENCSGSYDNVVFEYNGGRSLATAYGARVVGSNLLSRKAGRYGAITGKTEGFCALGAVPDPAYGKETFLLLHNPVSIDDAIAISANAADSVVVAYGAKIIRAGVAVRTATAGARAVLYDPRQRDCVTLKQGAGVQIINTETFE